MVAVLGNTRALAFLMGGILFGVLGGFFMLRLMVGGGGSAPAPAAPPPKVEFEGPVYKVKERVYNLADPNARRYLKLALSLQFTAEDDKYEQAAKAHGKEYETLNAAFAGELAPKADFIHDILTKVVSSKTMAEMLTPDGKNALATEITEKVNAGLPKEFHHHVKKVYYTDFVVQ